MKHGIRWQIKLWKCDKINPPQKKTQKEEAIDQIIGKIQHLSFLI